MNKISFQNTELPEIGFGTWCIGDNPEKKEMEKEAIRTAVEEYGMTLIDTAEMYGLGKSEAVVGEVIKELDRENIFVVDKILPENAYKGNFEKHVRKSLELMNCEYFDLYLLHWRANVNLQDMVDEMEALVEKGLIRHWGVSNFDVADMEELFQCKNGTNCYANQFLYNMYLRGVEYDLLPWCIEHDVLPMIYSPLGDTREKQLELLEIPEIKQLCEKKEIAITNLMLRFVIRNHDVVTLFKTSSIAHLEENLKGLEEGLTEEDKQVIDAVFPSPDRKMPLEKI